MERETEVSIRLSSENTITLYWNWIIWPYVVIDWLLNFSARQYLKEIKTWTPNSLCTLVPSLEDIDIALCTVPLTQDFMKWHSITMYIFMSVLQKHYKTLWDTYLSEDLASDQLFSQGYTEVRGMILVNGKCLNIVEFLVEYVWCYMFDIIKIRYEVWEFFHFLSEICKNTCWKNLIFLWTVWRCKEIFNIGLESFSLRMLMVGIK